MHVYFTDAVKNMQEPPTHSVCEENLDEFNWQYLCDTYILMELKYWPFFLVQTDKVLLSSHLTTLNS